MNNEIRAFFERRILPLHQQAVAEGKDGLDRACTSAAPSYFGELKHADKLYLNTVPIGNETELEAYLRDFWKAEPSLLELVPEFAQLAFRLKEENREQSAELSPFVYAMF